ncbi:hypothetical protein MKW98_014674 [Papaver atlanticum]|uniref:RING-type domain-containing protein n=1 Tax=Papaver atlanticum TaxID=357466 RepID=A0AAD4SEW6_9MAGN|nr:hypothetical protein MKW98_014674 [Papaver atlanticum]
MASPETASAAVGKVAYQNDPPLSLSISATSNTDDVIIPKNEWSPFESRADFNLDIALLLVFLVCFILSGFTLNLCINKFLNKGSPPPDYQQTQRLKLQEMAKSSGPTLEYSQEIELAGNEPLCAICLSEFVNGEEIRVLSKCNHGFHVKCIEAWLLSFHTSCPTCRTTCMSTSQPPLDNNQGGDENNDLESGFGNTSRTEVPVLPTAEEQSNGSV